MPALGQGASHRVSGPAEHFGAGMRSPQERGHAAIGVLGSANDEAHFDALAQRLRKACRRQRRARGGFVRLDADGRAWNKQRGINGTDG